jgi:hypothetical protein
MREGIESIVARLRDCRMPEEAITAHVREVEAWRATHPVKIKRRTLSDDAVAAAH